MSTPLTVGDKISRAKANGFVQHVGIYLGNCEVFHNLPGKGEHVSTFAEFAAGQPVTLLERHPEVNPIQLNWRVQQRLQNRKPYDAVSYNCEHAATYLLTGKEESVQVQGWAAAAAVVLLGLAIMAK